MEKFEIELTAAEAVWLKDHLKGWWEGSYSGLDEIDYFMPILTIYKALDEAGVVLTDGSEK